MNLTIFTSLKWAYQLHYYLGFQTYRRRKLFDGQLLNELIQASCIRYDYHLLEAKPFDDHLRSLVSLRPDQVVAKAVQQIKANSSTEWSIRFGTASPFWARGYLAQSVGDARIEAISRYIEDQDAHHGYASRLLSPVSKYKAEPMVPLLSPHSFFDLSHHLVIATKYRHGIFDSRLGSELIEYWLQVAKKRDFAIDQVTVVPDHVHSIVRIKPAMCIEECALCLMNNAQHFVGEHYPKRLIEAGLTQLWQPSAYAGTCGEYSTGLIQKWLRYG